MTIPAVVVVLHRADGRVLLCRRHDDDRTAPGWCLPGGKIDPGEDALTAAHRELLEETGTKGVHEGFLTPREPLLKGRSYHVEVVTMALFGSCTLRCSPEHAEVGWFTLEDAFALTPMGGMTRSILVEWATGQVLYWPISRDPSFPDEPGLFGAYRRFDRHTGIDLYCDPGTPVRALEEGVVVLVEPFTGVDAGSPWWHDTDAVLVEGASGVLVYGEVAPSVRPGDKVQAGQPIATVQTVLKKDKGRPMTMLHFERLAPGTRQTFWWRLDSPKPEPLLDPTDLLSQAAGFRPHGVSKGRTPG